MLNTVNTKKLINKRIAISGFFLIAAVFALLPAITRAQCSTGWDASGKWSFMQRNATRPVELDLRQNGKAIAGSATLVIPGSGNFLGKFGETKIGNVDGTILGDRFSIEIAWVGGGIGVYNARILPSGKVEGEGFEKSSPNVRHAWNSTGVIKCLPVASKPKPKPPGGIGKIPPPTTPGGSQPAEKSPPSTTAPQPLKPPAIVAGNVIYPNILVPMGFVILQWDAGPDHRYAEVWFKVNNGDETFLVEQGKGSRQVPVERGKLYTYILTDAGETLATVTIVAQ
jgi:hypothetical protein